MGQSKGSARRAGTARPDPRRRKNGVDAPRRSDAGSRLRDAVVSLDAEDIALARLQAHLRRAETIQVPVADSAIGRTTVRLPQGLLKRARDRAERDGTTISEVIARALERFLRPR
jgi:hypothetical protein